MVGAPDHVPLDAFSVLFWAGVPEIVGGRVFFGAPAFAFTTAVALELKLPLP